MDLALQERVYIVSGGSRGLGFASAQALVAEGARVVIVSRDAAAVTAAVESLGAAAAGHVADLSDPDTARQAVSAALEHFGRLDGALISVGGPPPGSVLTTTDDQWRSAFDSVFLGSLSLAREVCSQLLASGSPSGGAIAWVLSTSAVEVFPGLTVSNGLRPGLAMLVKDLADEVGPSGIRVVGLLPGRIGTERLALLDEATGDAAASRARSEAAIPLRRYGEPAEFGRVAAFALSPAASYITGTLIAVDGGSTRHP